MVQNFRKTFVAFLALAALAVPALAVPITANVGWTADEVPAANTPSAGSPYTFSLSAGQTASFKVTDEYAYGDSLRLFSGATLLADSSAYAGTPNAIMGDFFGENGWLDAGYEKIEYIVSGAGAYSFSIMGDGVGGFPAGFYVRLDVSDTAAPVPEPGSLALLGLGLLALPALRRRKG